VFFVLKILQTSFTRVLCVLLSIYMQIHINVFKKIKQSTHFFLNCKKDQIRYDQNSSSLDGRCLFKLSFIDFIYLHSIFSCCNYIKNQSDMVTYLMVSNLHTYLDIQFRINMYTYVFNSHERMV